MNADRASRADRRTAVQRVLSNGEPSIQRAYVGADRSNPGEKSPLSQRVVDRRLRDLHGDGASIAA